MSEPLRQELESWLNQQNQAVLEEVMATWQGAVSRFRPDAALLERLGKAMPAPAADPKAGSGEADLAAALDLLEGATSQGELLKRLLDGLTPLVERSALFVLKQGQASLYAHRGFPATAPLRSGPLTPTTDLDTLILGQARVLTGKGPGYSALLAYLSPTEAADQVIIPLRHKRKTVALLLVDSGSQPSLSGSAQARALALGASAMLAALAAVKEDATAVTAVTIPPPPEPPPASTPTQVLPEPAPAPADSGLDPKTRAAAERLARVLVGDVELYYPAQAAQAKSQGNLYGLLRDELDRSRTTFVERFGEETENKYRIFTTTVVQLLCDGEASRLGAAPWA